MTRPWLALPLLCASVITPVATAAAAEDPFWQRGRDGRFEVAFVGIAIGSTLEFLCSAYQVPNTAIITLRNVILGAQLEDGQNYELRFVVDGRKFDLPGIARDGELMVSPADANLELWVQELLAALMAGEQAQIAVPSKGWRSPLPLDGAAQALDGVFEVCL
jgi:hypothetical protein